MELFDVYPVFNIEPVKGEGCYVWDKEGNKYLDLYGGHAVISIGHSHPRYVDRISSQIEKLGFYSNSIINQLQVDVAHKLGELSGYSDYSFFFCNSGAEANENALKLASFHNGRKRIVAFKKGFHGRTSAAVAITDNPSIIAPINSGLEVTLLDLNDLESVKRELAKNDVAALVIEGIQGIGGIFVPDSDFMEGLQDVCEKSGTVLILDEIQSGYGRSGKFFAHQFTKVKPDLITVAKGMGNGFPVGGLLVNPKFKASHGLLGTTFGGNHLACAASMAVLEILDEENLIKNSMEVGQFLKDGLQSLSGLVEVRGQGLMLGLEFDFEIAGLRRKLLFDHKIFTGVSGKNIIRLLPPLSLTKAQANHFIETLKNTINS